MKIFQVLLLLSILGLIFAQDCNNPLLQSFRIEGLDQPTVPQGNLTFCPAFQNQAVCCDAATINGFQASVDATAAELNNAAAQRDRWFADNYNSAYTLFLQNFYIFQASMNAVRNNTALFNALRDKFLYINTTAVPLRTAVRSLATNYAQYQQARARCFRTMLDYHATAHCLACNPNYNSLGVFGNGSVNLNNRVCTTIKNSCFDYIQQSNSYSLLIAFRQVSDQLYQANEFLADLDLEDENVIEEVQDEEVPYEREYELDNSILQPTVLPPNCTTAANCNWLCTDVFGPTQLDTQALAVGGITVEALSFEDITNRSTAVNQTGGGGRRFLQANDTQNQNATQNQTTTNNQTAAVAAADDQADEDELTDGSLDNIDDPNTVVGTEPALDEAAFAGDDDGSLDNVAADDSVIGPDPITAVGGDDDVATGPIVEGGVPGGAPTGTWNPPVGASGAQINVDPNPSNVTLSNPVDENTLQQNAQAFQEPPDPNDDINDQQEAALSGSVLTISSILLGVLVMFYLE